MFTKKVTDDDNFMALSSSAQALYLHLSMSADDDGFCNQVAISMFKAHASVQDLQALLEKRYIYQFENGVIVIKHWRMANALRKDRYTATAFQEELSKLKLKDNGVYTLSDDGEPIRALPVEEQEDGSETSRQAAYRESSLPYSFDYKIRNAFYGKLCPICGAKMEKSIDEAGVVSDNRMPTIQHNLPISKGGKHELGNISVICRQCNVTIQDTETEALNAEEVAETWEKLDGCRLVAACLPQDRLGKDRVDKDRLSKGKEARTRFTPPTVDEIAEYCLERGNGIDAQHFVDYYARQGWKLSNGIAVKDWKACVRTWETRNGKKQEPPKRKSYAELAAEMDEAEGIV